MQSYKLIYPKFLTMSTKGKVCIITGASSGIGKATALHFAKKGWHVVLAGRNIEKLEEVEKKCRSFGRSHLVIQADVSKEEDCQQIINKTIEEYSSINVLINNAGISMRALFKDTDLEVLKQIMDINFWGAVYCTKYALPHLLACKGSVIAISSIAGYKGLPARTGYSASKFAMNGFFEALRLENLKTNLHVGIMAPGFTASNIRNRALIADGSVQKSTPREEEKMMSAEEVAENIYQMVKTRKDFQALTQVGKLTILLNKFFPKWMDKKVYTALEKEKNSPLKRK